MVRHLSMAIVLTLVLVGCTASSPGAPQGAGAQAPPQPSRQTGKVAPGPPIKMVGAYVAVTGAMAVAWVAQEAGIFQKHGLDVDLRLVGMRSKPIEAMLAGDLQFLEIAAPPLLEANLAGADTVMVAGLINKPHQSLMVVPAVTSPGDLRGRNLGTSERGSSTDFLLRLALRRWGLEPDRDVPVLTIGDPPQLLAAMEVGAIDGGLMSEPTTTRARLAGYHGLAKVADLGLQYQSVAMATTRSYVRDNREAVRRLVAATSEAVYFFRKDRDTAMKVIGQYSKVDDVAILEGTYETFSNIVEEVPYPTMEGIQANLDEIADRRPEAKSAKPQDFVDLTFLKELEEKGLYRQLGGR